MATVDLVLRAWALFIGTLLLNFILGSWPVFAADSVKIYWLSDPVRPGETVLVRGEGLDTVDHVTIRRLPDRAGFRVDEKTLEHRDVAAVQAGQQSLKFMLPDELQDGLFTLDLVGANQSARGILNIASIYWMQGDQGLSSTPGGWVRLLGRNISRGAGAVLELRAKSGGAVRSFAVEAGSLWFASFTLPDDMLPGNYDARLWNGQGDERTAVSAGVLEVRPQATFAPLTFNIRDFGSAGRIKLPDTIVDVRDHETSHQAEQDDTDAVTKALRELGTRGGGTLFFPRGQYVLSGRIDIPRGVALKGEGEGLVSLNWRDFELPPLALLSGASDFAIEDLTINTSNHSHVIAGGFYGLREGEVPSNISVRRVRIRASAYRGHVSSADAMKHFEAGLTLSSGGPDTIRLAGNNLAIVDCDLYGSGRSLYLERPNGAYIARNVFSNGRRGWYSITGANGVIVEENIFQGADMQSTGGGVNTIGQDLPSSKNVLFLRNKFQSIFGWDREALTSDGAGGYYYGNAVSVDGNTVDLTDKKGMVTNRSGSWAGAGLFVLAGQGAGQYARIRFASGQRITLDDKLLTDLNTDSLVTIVSAQQNYLIVGNEFIDSGVAAQFYGTAYNNVVADNRSVRTGGFVSRGIFYRHAQPSWFVQFLGNEIVEGNVYRGGPFPGLFAGEAVLGIYGWERVPNMPPLAMAQIIRRNRLLNNAHIEVRGVLETKGQVRDAPGVNDVIVENNIISNAAVGVSLGGYIEGIYLHNNVFNNVDRDIVYGVGGVP